MENSEHEPILKTYKCKSSSKTNTSFNRKLERSNFKINNRYTTNINNKFYTNHYTTRNNNNQIYLENLRESSVPVITTKFINKLNPCGMNNSDFSASNANNVKYCLNCGNYGHSKGQCSEPNISNGVVAVRYNIDKKRYEYLIVMRKHSHGYCDIIRGKYPDNVEHIRRLLEETTQEERTYMLEHEFNENWTYLWGEKNNILTKFRNTKMLEAKFVAFKKKYLTTMVDDIQSKWTEPEWGFPKGQRDGFEKNIETAFREFSEESGYGHNKCVCVSNLMPLQESFIGSNNKKYKQLYYMALMNYEDTMGIIPYEENEIGDALWVSIRELVNKFRHYDEEKTRIALDVHTILKTSLFTYI